MEVDERDSALASSPMDDGDDEALANVVPLRLISGTPADLVEHPKLSLANVKGLARNKSILRQVIDELTRTNREPPLPGMLLYGPPNCGKTYLCRVLAGELQAAFIPIDCHELINAEVAGARIVQDAWHIAQRNMPCVLLFDEIDVLHHEESEITEIGRTAIVSAIGEVLDAAAEATEQRFVVAATATNPWHVPAELVSAERLGTIVLVLPPDEPARAAMLRAYLPDLTLDDDVDVDWLAHHTDGYSATDLARLCEISYGVARDNGKTAPAMADLKNAFNNTRPNAAQWLDRAAHQAMLSQHTGLYDDLLDYLNARRK